MPQDTRLPEVIQLTLTPAEACLLTDLVGIAQAYFIGRIAVANAMCLEVYEHHPSHSPESAALCAKLDKLIDLELHEGNAIRLGKAFLKGVEPVPWKE